MHFRRLPEEKGVTFKGEAKVSQPKKTYIPNESRDIQLHLTSSDAEAKEAQFKILSWEVANGKQGTLNPSSISLGNNTLHYTPQESGTHELTLKVAVEGEEESAQTFRYTLEAPASEWQVGGEVDGTGNLNLTITNAPEEWRSALWHIQSTRWSRGIRGSIVNRPTQVQYGENTFPITLQEVALEALPQVHFNIQGPDSAFQSINIDLREVCVARLEETYSEDQVQALREHNAAVRQQASTYQGNYTGNARVEAQRTLGRLLDETTNLQQKANVQLERLENNLNILGAQDITDLAALETRRNAMQRELEALTVSRNILQPMMTQLRESNQGPIDPWGVLHQTLQQGQYDEANMAPHLASPLLSDALNTEGDQDKPLLHLSIEQGHIALSRSLIGQGAKVNMRDLAGNTPLYYATEANNQEAISLLLGAGGEQNLPPDWRLQGNYDTTGQQMILTISDAPGQLQQARAQQAQWCITDITWSEGIGGTDIRNTVLRHGENRVPLAIGMDALHAVPSVQVLLQGPDRAFQSINIDLREVCVARLEEGEIALTEREDNINRYVQETEAVYQLPPETVTDPRINREKQNKVERNLRQLEASQTQYERDLQALTTNLDALEQTQVNEHLAVFEANNKRLKDAIASLKSAQVQLQQECATAHEALFKVLENEEQQAIETLLEDPRLDVNAQNEQGTPLLCIAADKWNKEAIRKILVRGGNRYINTMYKRYTPLQISIRKNSADVATLMLEKGADVNVYDTRTQKYFLTYETESPPPVVMVLEKMADEEGSDFEEQFTILRSMLNNGSAINAYYEYFVPVEEYLKHSSCESIDEIKIFEEVTKDDRYVKLVLDLCDCIIHDLEGEKLDRVCDLMNSHGWSL